MSRPDRRQRAETRGRQAETKAALLLRAKGFAILSRRYRTPVGEIDLVAGRGQLVVFVEVKWRSTIDAGLESIHPTAQARIARAADHWLSRHPKFANYNTRFDVVALAPWRWPVHLKQAFDTPDPF
uniref:YraN family protein n=1 Tax=Pararhizobium sp. IMCC3301 TaxID=3067904 RepID=UPI00274087F5|nr:YraN family protein [Pararhizobium sp. IMCC3301]